MIGGLAGIALGFAIEPTLSANLAVVFGGGLEMSWTTALQAVGLAFVIGLVIGVPPAVSASRLAIVDALRERE